MITRGQVYMLIQDNRQLERTRSYLLNRGYDMLDFRDQKKLLEAVMRHPQATVFLSMSYTASELVFLAKSLQELYNCTVVYFSEEDSVQGSAKLFNVRARHKLFGRLSGPAIERTLRSLHQAQRAKAPTSKRAVRTRIEAQTVMGQIQKRLHTFMDGNANAWMKRTSQIRKVDCYKFYFEKTSQVFLIATAQESATSESTSRKICEAIKVILMEQGLKVVDESRFAVTAEPFDFSNWALNTKSPHFTTADKGIEWGIALCDSADQLEFELDVRDQEMYRVPIENLASGETIDFDLYVFFPASRKMVLLVPRNSKLTPGTYSALRKNLIPHLNVFKDDRHRMRRFLFEKHLRNSIVQSFAQNSA